MKKQLLKILKRLKKKRIFLAVASGIVLLLLNMGVIGADMADKLDVVIDTVLSIGVAVGIFSNPVHEDELNEDK